jgi:cytochrome c553
MSTLSLVILFTGLTNVWADANAIKAKALTCAACHGAGGVSPNPLWPNLAGQKEQYILAQLHAFHDGGRVNALMTPQAKMLDEQDMRDLAHYFAGLKAAQ